MTLNEKVGQLTLFASTWDTTGPTIDGNYVEYIRSGRCGAVFNVYTTTFTRHLQKIAVEESRLKIPLLFGLDIVHGHRTIFPIPLAESCSWDLAAIETSARIAAREAAAEGLHWTFAPMVDIARDPRWGRVAEGAGEDSWLGSRIAAARVRGFQGKDLAASDTVLACAKHFAAYGAAQAGRDYHTVDVSERTLEETYLPPFKACVDAGVRTIMPAFNEIAGVPCTASSHLLTGILRERWGFSGFVVTDYTAINELIPHGVASDAGEAGRLAFLAGSDMDMQSGAYMNHLAALVKNGMVPLENVDDAVRRIIRVKFELGLFEDPFRYCDPEREKQMVLTSEHLETAREIAQKSMVLLKNEGNLLPLSRNLKTLAVIGPLARATSDLLGPWCAAGDGAKAPSIHQALCQKLGPEIRILFEPGSEIVGTERHGFAAAVKAAGQADVVILILGESAGMSGEAASRADIDLPGVQNELAEAVAGTGTPVVAVLLNGRPLALSRLQKTVPAILEAWFPGTMGGEAVADILFGDTAPSGKLTIT
ncbi:MAG TPA: glycoside hydrolase family 3 N-terminal domain-containing protein, partial [Candidatus Ozemobacteraceae bacterium]|nr:glycoside hydrolase family 3 N-terminal domain-containing protein [Candidatus Ozemobacteraceae bacterium]